MGGVRARRARAGAGRDRPRARDVGGGGGGRSRRGRAAREARGLVHALHRARQRRARPPGAGSVIGAGSDGARDGRSFAAATRLLLRRRGRGADDHRPGREVAAERRRLAAALPGPVADTYGAGDSFAAGLTFALARGDTREEAIAFAARCGAAVLTGRGPYTAQLTAT